MHEHIFPFANTVLVVDNISMGYIVRLHHKIYSANAHNAKANALAVVPRD
jgi:hypothetical protein